MTHSVWEFYNQLRAAKLSVHAWAVLGLVWTGLAQGQEATSEYLTVRLPHGVSLKMPRSWRVLTDDSRITLNAAAEALQSEINAERLPSSLPFAANYYDGNRVTAGILNVRYYPDLETTQAVARSLTAADLREVDAELRNQIAKVAEAGGNRVLEWRGTVPRDISGLRFLVTEYRRTSPTGGSFRVRLVRLFDATQSFTVTISYREDERVLRPIVDYMTSSLVVLPRGK